MATLQELQEHRQATAADLAEMEARLGREIDGANGKLDVLDERVHRLSEKFDGLEERMTGLEAKMDAGFAAIEARVVGLHDRLTGLATVTHQVLLALEKEGE